MKDVDLARDRPVFRRGQESSLNRSNWTFLHYDDARTGFDYLTSAECDEINAACNAFFKRKKNALRSGLHEASNEADDTDKKTLKL